MGLEKRRGSEDHKNPFSIKKPYKTPVAYILIEYIICIYIYFNENLSGNNLHEQTMLLEENIGY